MIRLTGSLEELNMQQAQAGLRDSVTDHQVDEILRSVGILSLPDEPLPEDTLAFPEETRAGRPAAKAGVAACARPGTAAPAYPGAAA